MEEVKKFNGKNITLIILLVVVALLSIFVIAPRVSSTEFHAKSIKTLDDKKMTVTGITASMAAVSSGLALVPGDATTPLANQIIKISSYMLIIVATIFLEKILLTLTGYLAFKFMIPIACLLLGIYVFVKKDILVKLASKIIAFGLILFMLVPASINISNFIENSNKEAIENAKNAEVIITEDVSDEEEDKNWFSNIKEGVSNIGNKASEILEKGKQVLSNFIDTAAILIITTCVIPIIVLILMIWIVKIFIGIEIPTSNLKLKEKKAKKEKIDDINKEEKI